MDGLPSSPSRYPSSPEGETHRPMEERVPVPEYAPGENGSSAQARSRRLDLFGAPGTYLLVGVNCAVFLWMVLHGVSAQSPTPNDLVRFGANYTGSVLNHGEWYRLLTATFVHVGWIHLGTNMWCLWNLGLLGEPLLGPYGLVAVYMLTGVAGNLLSTAVNLLEGNDGSVGAGASGAVFGIAGILIVLLSNRRLPIPWEELRRLRRSVIQFAVLNLVIGGATAIPGLQIVRIDNMAHLGGFFSGLALGGPLAPRMTAGRQRYLGRQKITFGVAALLLSLFGYLIANLR
jgi:rhomboid protease GluP